ncbi:MAG: sel1 repeat family protein [Clostridiales bacterium]|nr:sel1 repeat family protein [Clostridiales bacterium]
MICQNCNKNIVKPLELYNGDWACPFCKATVGIKSIAVKVNKENDETFKLSELCYLRALKKQKDPTGYERELNSAIEYCRTAARMGNPKALLRLGFFYEHGYITADATESIRIAYEYYKLVWSSTPEMEERPADRDYAESCIKLRSAAAKLYLELLKKLPQSFRRVGGLDFAEERAKIIDKGLPVPDDDGAERVAEDRIMRILGVLQSCYNRERAPLFGIMRLEKGEYGQLLAARIGKSGLTDFAKKILIVLFDADNGEFRTIKTEEDGKSLEPDNAYYLYFFNAGGAHSVAESKCKRISDTLRKNSGLGEYSGVKRIIESMGKSVDRTDMIFSVDDVLRYKSKLEPFAHATDQLINSMQNK